MSELEKQGMESFTELKGELDEFVLEEKEDKVSPPVLVAGSIENLENWDFTKDQDFNIEENYEFVQYYFQENEDENIAKLMEAENIVNKEAKKYLDEEFVDSMEKERENLKAFLKKYSTELETTKALSEDQINKLDRIAKYIFDGYQRKLNLLNYKLPLTREEYKFIYATPQKLEFDQNEVFQMEELRKSYFELHKDLDKKIPKDMPEIPTYINVNSLILLYHFVSKNKVKGIGKEFFTYKDLLTKIGERMKLYNAYSTLITRLSTDFVGWASTITTLIEERAKSESNDKK